MGDNDTGAGEKSGGKSGMIGGRHEWRTGVRDEKG
jgi:hypothetical protein